MKPKIGAKARKPIRKKSDKTKMYDKIHAVMREIAILEYGNKCVICGRTNEQDVIQGGHVIPKKSSLNTRFDRMNVFPQCRTCNSIHTRNQAPYIAWYIKTFGVGTFDALLERSRITKQFKQWELDELLEQKKQELKRLQNKTA